jgi:haloalkane dehalogenase
MRINFEPDRGLYPFEPHWFETGNIRIHYVDEGRGDPLLILAGAPWSSAAWP